MASSAASAAHPHSPFISLPGMASPKLSDRSSRAMITQTTAKPAKLITIQNGIFSSERCSSSFTLHLLAGHGVAEVIRSEQQGDDHADDGEAGEAHHHPEWHLQQRALLILIHPSSPCRAWRRRSYQIGAAGR